MIQSEQASNANSQPTDVASVRLTNTANAIGWVSTYDAGGNRLYAHGPVRFEEAVQEWAQLQQTYPAAEALEILTDR